MAIDTGEVISACLNNAELHERDAEFSVSSIFSVDSQSGTVRLASAIRGGPHGTLDFEAAAAYGFIVAVSDSGGLRTLIPIVVDVLDVNEPPIFIHSCPTDNSVIACPQIPEKLNSNKEYSDRAFLRISWVLNIVECILLVKRGYPAIPPFHFQENNF